MDSWPVDQQLGLARCGPSNGGFIPPNALQSLQDPELNTTSDLRKQTLFFLYQSQTLEPLDMRKREA